MINVNSVYKQVGVEDKHGEQKQWFSLLKRGAKTLVVILLAGLGTSQFAGAEWTPIVAAVLMTVDKFLQDVKVY